MLTCPNCNTANEDGSRFCSQCGTKLEQIRICPVCGEKLASNAKFCHGCGYNLSDRSENVGAKDNVFGGNVDGSFNTTNNYINTFRNESADIIECEVCGKMLSKGSGEAYKCRKCGKIYCSLHFDTEYNMCSVCAEEPRKTREKERAAEKKSREEAEAFNSVFIAEYNEQSGMYTVVGVRDKNIEEISVPDCVEAIGEGAFMDCKKLVSAEISFSVKKIGANAFCGCESLESFNLPFYLERIENKCFSGCRSITSAIIPVGVTHIGDEAFAFCRKLEMLSLPRGIKSFGKGAFKCCGIDSVILPNALEKISDDCFSSCSNLCDIMFVNGLKSIGTNAFSNCDALEEVKLPESLEKISSGAFDYCESLSYVYIPASVKYLYRAFDGCNSITFEVSPENKNYCEKGGCLIDITAKELIYMGAEGKIPADGSVKSIGEGAFFEFTEISEIEIPEGVERISEGAFDSCYGLEKVYVPLTVKHIGANAFDSCNEGLIITYAGTRAAWDAMYDEYEDEVEVVCLGKTLTQTVEKGASKPNVIKCDSKIGFTVSSDWLFSDDEEDGTEDENDENDGLVDGAFTAAQKKAMASILEEDLEDAKIIDSLCPEKIKTENVIVKKSEPKPGGKIILSNGSVIPISGEISALGSYKNNKSIVKVILPESIKSIPDGAFEGCNMLVEIEAPSVTWIGTRAFWGCISLKSAIFPKGITHIGVSAFECCYMLSEINLAKGLDLINNSAFKGCKMLSGISIPESVRGINDFAFTDCESLREIRLHNNASYIGKYAFAGCKNLSAVRVADCKNDLLRSGKGLESIFSCAFEGCANLKELNLPQSVRRIDEDAFKGCTELTITADPNNFYFGVKGNCIITKDTETLLFANAHSTIPADGSVKAFGKHCMVAQAGVKSVNIPHGVTNIGTEAFAGCTSLSSVSLPAGIKKLGWGLFFGCTALKEIVFDGTKAEWDAIEKSELGKSLTVYVKGLFGAKKAVRTHSEY